MIDFKKIIADKIQQILNNDEIDVYSYIEIPPEPAMGDFAFPCFKLAKDLKKSPQIIASNIKDKFNENEYIEKIDVAGAYLNFYIKKNIYIKNVIADIWNKKEMYGTNNIGNGKTALVEYSSPNIAKPFHIGHLRSTVIGGALYNIYKFMGYNTIGINHVGDWGIQFGKVMAGISLWGAEYDFANEETVMNEILKIYVRYSNEEKENAELTELARTWFIKLEKQDEEAVKTWKWIKEASLKNYEKTYQILNSKFDSFNGEAFYNDKMDQIVEELKEKKLLIPSEGAQIVDLSAYDMAPCIILTSAGTTIYATRDLAAFKYRMNEYHFDKMVYVVGSEQQLHFKQIFKVMELMGYGEYVKKSSHVYFGLIVDKNGEKIGSRKGNAILLDDIINEAINKSLRIIEEKNATLENKEEIAKQIGVGAIIFNDLSNSRIKDEIFDWDMILNFNGETGPYIQMMYVRTRSIIEKANITITNIDEIDISIFEDNQIYEIIKLMNRFEEVLLDVIDKNEPSILSRYLIDLAQAFSAFYAKFVILDENIENRKAKVLLTKMVGDILKKGMNLLGIGCPEKM